MSFDWWAVLHFIGVMALILLITALVVAGLAYILVLFARFNRAKRDVWENTAAELGLELEHKDKNYIYKPMAGNYGGRRVRISSERIRVGEGSDYDPFTIGEVCLPVKPDFSFEIRSAYGFVQKLKSAIGRGDIEIGVPDFDERFNIESADREKVCKLLGADLPDGLTPTLHADLLLIDKSYFEIRITDQSVRLKKNMEIIERRELTPILDDAAYLAGRIEAALINR